MSSTEQTRLSYVPVKVFWAGSPEWQGWNIKEIAIEMRTIDDKTWKIYASIDKGTQTIQPLHLRFEEADTEDHDYLAMPQLVLSSEVIKTMHIRAMIFEGERETREGFLPLEVNIPTQIEEENFYGIHIENKNESIKAEVKPLENEYVHFTDILNQSLAIAHRFGKEGCDQLIDSYTTQFPIEDLDRFLKEAKDKPATKQPSTIQQSMHRQNYSVITLIQEVRYTQRLPKPKAFSSLNKKLRENACQSMDNAVTRVFDDIRSHNLRIKLRSQTEKLSALTAQLKQTGLSRAQRRSSAYCDDNSWAVIHDNNSWAFNNSFGDFGGSGGFDVDGF